MDHDARSPGAKKGPLGGARGGGMRACLSREGVWRVPGPAGVASSPRSVSQGRWTRCLETGASLPLASGSSTQHPRCTTASALMVTLPPGRETFTRFWITWRVSEFIRLCRAKSYVGSQRNAESVNSTGRARLFQQRRHSCQLLAQTTHNYTLTKKGGKPALEHTSQRVQRVKLDTDQPSMLPAQHARHRAHFLQQTH